MGLVLEFNDYTIAWIAPLRIDKLAALRMLDKIHEGNFRYGLGDDYQYVYSLDSKFIISNFSQSS